MNQPRKLSYSVHPAVWGAIALLFTIQLIVIGKMRGIGDHEGYLLNTSRIFSINTYEDDGSANIALALGHAENLPRYLPYGMDIGGPYLYLGRLVLRAADRLGLITIFADPSLYLLYPDTYKSVWKTFAIYKAALLILVPLSLYWLCSNHYNRSSGILAAWIFVAMPFVPGFETRLKVDSLAVAVGLLSIIHQLQYVRTRQERYFIYAAIWLGLTLSMKFIFIPAGVTLACIHAYCSINHPGRLHYFFKKGLLAAFALLAVYVMANPMALSGWLVYAQSITRHLGENTTNPISTLSALWLRWSSLDIFLGPIFIWIIPPALILFSWLIFYSKEYRLLFGTLLALLILQTIYFSVSFRGTLANTTYYYYSHSIVVIPIISICIIWFRTLTIAKIPWLTFLVTLAICISIILTFKTQFNIIRYLTSLTDRQSMLLWINQNLPPGTSLGVPIEKDTNVINTLIQVDPFTYRVIPVGKDAALVTQFNPDYVLWVRTDPSTPPLAVPGYTLAARFNDGVELPHNRYDLYQEEVYEIYARREKISPRIIPKSPWDLEYDIGQFVRQDPELQFNILQFQGLHFYPITLNLFRKTQSTVSPFPTQAFATSIRYGTSPLAYIHQADPLCLTLWGIKYVIADMRPESAFVKNTITTPEVPLVPVQRLLTTFDNQAREIGIFKNTSYLGQAFFAAAPNPSEVITLRKARGRLLEHPIKTYGELYPENLLQTGNISALEAHFIIETDTTVDILIKNSHYKQSYLVGPGYHDIILPFSVTKTNESVSYEINPISESGKITVHALSASPLRLERTPIVSFSDVDPNHGFVHVESTEPGRVIFALPDHGLWRAEVDGQKVKTMPGPAGCVSVPIPAGEHFIALRTTFLE